MRAASPVLIVAGPTASGKSALALRLAERLGGVVINADSMQVYRELRVLTSRPDAEALARAPHRLYGVLPAAERCSAGRWRRLALAEIAAAQAAGRLPVVTGGTGLYVKALADGLAPVPEIPAAAVAEAEARLGALGGEAMQRALAVRDPAAARLRPTDGQRLVRAWSVLAATGRPLSDWQRQPAAGPAAPEYRYFRLLLDPLRPALYAACDARFDAMMAAGALDEARALLTLGLDPRLPAMKALGVAPLRRHLAGEIGRDDAVAAAKRATRQFAKRQGTWFRHQYAPELAAHAQFSESLVEEIFPHIRQFLLTRRERAAT